MSTPDTTTTEPEPLCGCEGMPCAQNVEVTEDGRECGSCGGPCHPYFEDEEE